MTLGETLILVPQVGFAIPLLMTIREQWQCKASTIPLVSSVYNVVALVSIGLGLGLLGLWWNGVLSFLSAGLWLVIFGQRKALGSA